MSLPSFNPFQYGFASGVMGCGSGRSGSIGLLSLNGANTHGRATPAARRVPSSCLLALALRIRPAMTPLPTRIKNALNEGRILILGAQVLLGFQYRAALEPGFARLSRIAQVMTLVGLALLVGVIALLITPAVWHRVVERGHDSARLRGFQCGAMLMAGFTKLPPVSRWIHVGGLACVALATILLITPAAYHRIAENGEDTERVHRVTSRLLLWALVPLALSLAADM